MKDLSDIFTVISVLLLTPGIVIFLFLVFKNTNYHAFVYFLIIFFSYSPADYFLYFPSLPLFVPPLHHRKAHTIFFSDEIVHQENNDCKYICTIHIYKYMVWWISFNKSVLNMVESNWSSDLNIYLWSKKLEREQYVQAINSDRHKMV